MGDLSLQHAPAAALHQYQWGAFLLLPSRPQGTGQWWEELGSWGSCSPSLWGTPRTTPLVHVGAKGQVSIQQNLEFPVQVSH